MAKKHLSCRLGLHDYVRAHPTDEQPRELNEQVCTHCGKRTTNTPAWYWTVAGGGGG